MKAEYRRVDQRQAVDILDLQSRLREEFKELTKANKRTAQKVPLVAAYYEHARGHRDDREKDNCGDTALLSLVQGLHKELAAVRQEIASLKGERGRGQGEHDRRTFFEKNFVDQRHDRGRGQRGKGKGKGKFYRVGAKNNVESAFHVATETFVPKCMIPECAGCFHAASECPTLSMNLYSADDDTVRRSYLAEFVTAEMQAAYDDEDDDAFCDICDAYGKAEVHKGPSANTIPSAATTDREPSLRQQYCGLKELSGRGRFAPIEPPLGAHSFVAKDATVTAAPPIVDDREKPQFILDKKVAFRTASVVHSDLWRDWESPVMDMTPTQDCGHFDAFTDIDETAIGDHVTEDCDDAVYEDALPEEVVLDPPAECETTFIEDFNYAPHQHFRKSDVDKFYPPYYDENRLAYFETEEDAAPPQPPPPRQRIGGGRKPSLLHTALLTTFFFSAFMAYVEECDATAATAQLAQPFAYEDA
ncbi:hypothetical protein CYMTET_50239 [Cymbomonas tetramitiformis]|uniref:Uncharacterized protein n=1 Tax=Cymbomonas tetramitiformis TaxID=36881 RepID=A0AAE0BQG2_9CHLO|nr:hypothetical protein CYMTET_50239 [Cymbomonas tetramitiformis]